MSTTVTDNAERNRYEVHGDGELAGFADYHKTDDHVLVFTHTQVDPRWEGQGVGSTLIRWALDDARRQGVKVLPICPFVQTWMARHPDYEDLDFRAPYGKPAD